MSDEAPPGAPRRERETGRSASPKTVDWFIALALRLQGGMQSEVPVGVKSTRGTHREGDCGMEPLEEAAAATGSWAAAREAGLWAAALVGAAGDAPALCEARMCS